MPKHMKYKARNLIWIKLLTLVWLTASVFAYPDALCVEYIEPEVQQNAGEASIATKHWDCLNVSNELSIACIESFWHIANISSFLLDGTGSDTLNPLDWLQYSCQSQSISLISFQYYHSALTA
jgi:hypothetical protein